MAYTAEQKTERYQSVHDKLASAVVELQDIANNSDEDSEESQSAEAMAGQLTNMVGGLSVKIARYKISSTRDVRATGIAGKTGIAGPQSSGLDPTGKVK